MRLSRTFAVISPPSGNHSSPTPQVASLVNDVVWSHFSLLAHPNIRPPPLPFLIYHIELTDPFNLQFAYSLQRDS